MNPQIEAKARVALKNLRTRQLHLASEIAKLADKQDEDWREGREDHIWTLRPQLEALSEREAQLRLRLRIAKGRSPALLSLADKWSHEGRGAYGFCVGCWREAH